MLISTYLVVIKQQVGISIASFYLIDDAMLQCWVQSTGKVRTFWRMKKSFFLQRWYGHWFQLENQIWSIAVKFQFQLLLNFSPRDWAKRFSYLWIFNHFCSIKCLYALNPLSFDEVSRRLFYSRLFHVLFPITGTTIAWRVTACYSCAIERFMALESSRIIFSLMVDFCLVGYFGKQWCKVGSHVHSLPCVGHSQG